MLVVTAWGVLTRRGTSAEYQHIKAGLDFASSKDGARAEKEWLEAVRLNSDSLESWNYLSEFYSATHQWKSAVETLHQVARLKPDSPHLYAHLATCNLQFGDERAAYRDAEEALKSDPNDAPTLTLFCGLLARTAEPKRRIELLRRLALLQPKNLKAKMDLAEVLVAGSLYFDAKPFVEEILHSDPSNAEAHSLHGVIVLNTDPSPNGIATAQADLLLALKEPLFAPFAHYNLGKIYKQQGQPKQAIVHLKEAAASLPNKKEVFFELAETYEQLGQANDSALARSRFEVLRKADLSHKP